MTVADSALDLQKLGIGARIDETMAIFRSNLPTFAAFAVLVGILGDLPRFLLIGKPLIDLTFTSPPNQALTAAFLSTPVLTFVVIILVPALIDAVASGFLVLAADDARSRRPLRVVFYVGATSRKIVPLFLVTLIVRIAVFVGILTLVVPALWIIGVFSVVVPAMMIERVGFSSLRRSAFLTKEYRWPIVGFFAVLYGFTRILGAVVTVVNPSVPTAIAVALSGAVDGIAAALFSIAATVVYARLREIKEGAGFGKVANVFS